MSKGSVRRPEDSAAITRNWPLKGKSLRSPGIATKKSAPACPFCLKVIERCAFCRREHCPCLPISDCRTKRVPKKVGDPKEQSPYGFEVRRETPDLANAPPEMDTPPLLNQKFMEQRGRL